MSRARGILAGALGGAAGAVQGMAQGYIEDERRVDVAAQLSQIEEQRQMRIAEAAEQRRRAGAQADFEQGLANAPRKTEAEIAAAKAKGPVEAQLAADRARALSPVEAAAAAEKKTAEAGAERTAQAEFGRDKAAQRGVRAKAQAGAVFSPAAYAEAELSRMKAEDLRMHRKLSDEYGKAQTDPSLSPAEREKKLSDIQRRIELNVQKATGKPIGQDEDTVRRVNVRYETDPLTGEKTGEQREETTEKRRRPATPGGAPGRDAELPTQAEAHEQARAAVARGADPEKVNARLREKGYPPLTMSPRAVTGKVQ